jgi:hypothetical protein
MTDAITPTAAPPSPSAVRARLLDLIIADLLGPANGPDEVLDEDPLTRYVLGCLAPTRQPALLDRAESSPDQGDLDSADDSDEDGPPDRTPTRTQGMRPTSIGLTCTLDGAATALAVTAHWGRYTRSERAADAPPGEDQDAREDTREDAREEGSKKGRRRLAWQRTALGGRIDAIPLRPGPIGPFAPDANAPDVLVRGLARRRDDEWIVTLYLTNNQAAPPARSRQGQEGAWIFQPEMSVEDPGGQPIFARRRGLRRNAGAGGEDLATQMAYRRVVEFATGHGVAVHADLASDRPDRAVRLATRVAPTCEVGRVTPPDAAEAPALAAVVLDMQALAAVPTGGFSAALGPLADAYAGWIDGQEAAAAADPSLRPYAAATPSTLAALRRNLARIRAGIALLDADAQAADAFRFANRAMADQRVRGLYAQSRRQGGKEPLEAFDLPANRRWYPFQLAFMLLNLPALSDIRHPDRSDETAAVADLLWFPTGGGKTEAYLGLTAYTLGLRRLQGIVGGYSGLAGVAVLMRYTLRLLTLQQFQRATALICACERIRREALAAGDGRWGAEPFRIGLWVGASSTPNSTAAAAIALRQPPGAGRGAPHQLTSCPWCGSPIERGRDLVVEEGPAGRGRTLVYCGDPLGRCPFSRRQAEGEGLPVVVVDEEIYRLLPALLIATVDKFAQLPWKGETQMLFGRVTARCSRHGFCSPELDCPDTHRRSGDLPAAVRQPVGPLRPPDLIIQDELHLISGPLGTMVGLYETAVDGLAEWTPGAPGGLLGSEGQPVRPKVVASTATIRRAAEQVNQLYLRRVNIFPPGGLDAADNFFARQRPPSPATPGRLYVGIAAPGARVRALLIRVYIAALAAAQKLYDELGPDAVDPYMTAVGYFNATRELGGMRRAVDDAVAMRLRRAAARGLANRTIEMSGVEELTSRKSAADIPDVLDRLELRFGGGGKRRPLDVLLATNMISVGVDVSRLGLMVVAGQPKTTAEYIQATSRVGRSSPGLVLVAYNWARPRDLSHYERFEHYHATFYQHVEPLSVTPFSPRARNRGLTGVLAGLLRLSATTFNDNLGAGRLAADHPLVAAVRRRIERRAALVAGRQEVAADVDDEIGARLDAWLARIQEVAGGGAQLGYKEVRDGQTLGLLQSADQGWSDFACLNSLREVEATAPLILDDRGMATQRRYGAPGAPAAPDLPEEEDAP